ncbi:MAG: hypothetical protein IJJ22_01230 [Oscillospiraceae bacterium]|nr:hypothetical protein [Oscillospiraceae bacterium]
MTNNAVIRLATFALIIFCFFAMFLTAAISQQAELRPAASAAAPIPMAGSALQAEAQLSTLSMVEEAGVSAPAM